VLYAPTSEPQVKFWTGLTEAEAKRRLLTYGPNVLPSGQKTTFFSIVAGTLKEPMILLLVATGIVYFVIGDLREAIAILASILVVIAISVIQKQRTEHTLEALRDLTSPRALVIRAEGIRRIPALEVVPGDIIILNEGDRVPADGRVRESVLLALDESLLTGESLPVQKEPLAEQDAAVYSGTLVVRGHGIAIITATGAQSEIGKIGGQLGSLTRSSTKLEKETAKVVRTFGIASLSVCVFVAALYGLVRGDWTKGIISSLALAISMVPEEFPVVLTIFLAIGAWRISQKKVLTRRFPAIEMLGAATVICVDKTGTLTENRMAVGEVFSVPQKNDTETGAEILKIAALASEQNTADPVDKAVLAAAGLNEFPGKLVREYPLSSDCMVVAKAYETGSGRLLVAAKGAPEEIFALSRPEALLAKDELDSALRRMSESGVRVIAVAKRELKHGDLPEEKRGLRIEVLGLIGFADPIRATVPAAITELADAGIRVVMITGDYPGTARSIAASAGLPDSAQVVTGDVVERTDHNSLRDLVRECSVFARVRPDQKLRLIEALKANNEVVAMTGDGVNDAPALKSAHIGIAMGARGSDVAREAAALVLSDDDFPAIVDAVRLGRRIYDNLTKTVRYIFAVHVPIAGLAVLPVLFGWLVLLMPLHIVFFELIVDPACSLAFEAESEEPGIMRRKPRSESARLFGRSTVMLGLFQGLGLFVFVLSAFVLAIRWGHSDNDARVVAFATLVFGNLALIWANRSSSQTVFETVRRRNSALWLVTAGTGLALLGIIYVPEIRIVFEFSTLHPIDWLVALSLSLVGITWFEVLKLIRRKRTTQASTSSHRTSTLKRIVVLALGWLFVLVGIAGLFLPVLQGILFLLVGLLILANEYLWARKLIARARSRFPRLDKWLSQARSRATTLLRTGARKGGL
jgi:Ca2+-transporting ATPase